MTYLIFSDETGTWSNREEDYYVRAWISISSEEYVKLQKEIFYIQKTTGTKEIKWDNFKRNYQKYSDVFIPNFQVYITLSIPRNFWNRNYKVLTTLQNLDEKAFTGDEKIKIHLRKKIINSAQAVIFLNYFERQHIENSKVALASNLLDYKYIVDTPQFIDREWIEVAREVGINNLEIKKDSESIPGIQMAGIIAGCFYDLLSKQENNDIAIEIYKKLIKPKMIDMYSSDRQKANPNIIFYGDCPDDIRGKITNIRNL